MDSVRENFHILLGQRWPSTAADSDIDLAYYFVSPGKRELSATLVAQCSDSGSLDLKLQESPTTVSSDWTDITDGAFTQLSSVSAGDTFPALEDIFFTLKTGTRYMRSYATVVGSGVYFGAAILNVIKRQA